MTWKKNGNPSIVIIWEVYVPSFWLVKKLHNVQVNHKRWCDSHLFTYSMASGGLFLFSWLELVLIIRTKYKRIRSCWTPELWLTLTWKAMTRQQTVSYQFMTLPLSLESRLIKCQTQVRAWHNHHQHCHQLLFKEILSNVECTGTLFGHFKLLTPGPDTY